MSSIGDIFLRLLLEKSGDFQASVEKEAQKAGDAGAQTLGQRLGSGLKTSLGVGLKGVAVATTAAFGIAAKGVIDLDNAVADFRKETGATAEEAEVARKAINRMSGDNLQGIEQIGKTLSKVTTDLGVTGDAAAQLTDDFLKFSRVTGRDAAEEVASFDDVLDAWNLTADKSVDIMDALTASHQKFGGSIAEDEGALASLAPVLKAANQSWEDGIALINLFKSSGADATIAVNGIKAALAKVKSPEELQRLIEDIRNTQDDFDRARKASELFGAKAGPQLANVLRPGSKALQDYRTSGAEVAGTMQEAAAASLTFGDRIQLAVAKIGAGIRDLGPAVTGVASAVSLLGSIGADRFLANFGPKILSGLKDVGARAGDALSDGLSSVWSGAGGTVIGNNIASRIENILDPTKSTVIGNAYRAAAAKAAVIYGVAFAASARVAQAVADAILLIPGAAAVKGALATAGAATGASYAAAFYAAFLGTIARIVIPTVVLAEVLGLAGDQFTEGVKKDLAAKVEAAVSGGTAEGIEAARKDIETALRGAKAGHLGQQLIDFYQGQLDRLNGALAQAPGAVTPAAMGVLEDRLQFLADHAAAGAPKLQMAGKSLAQAFQTGFESQLAQANQAVALGLEGIANSRTIIQKAKLTGAKTAGAFADAIRTRRLEVDSAWDLLLSTIKDHGTSNRAKVIGRLVSKTLAHALSSSNVEVRLRAEDTQRIYLENLSEIIPRGKGLSGRAAKAVADGLRSHNPDVRRAAEKVRSVAERPLKTLPSDAYGWGAKAGDSFADGIRSQIRNASNAAGKISSAVARILRLESPAKEGPMSKGGGPEGWGERLAHLYARGIRRKLGTVRKVIANMAGGALNGGQFSSPAGFAAPALAPAHAGFGATVTSVDPVRGGGDTFQLNTYGLPMRAETPLEVVGQWRRAARMGPQRARTGRWRNE